MSEPPILAIVGPTASGKSALAIQFALRWGGEVISADASQVYRGLDVLTGKLTPAERAGVPHHLLDVVELDEPFDAGAFARHADAAIAGIRSRGQRVVLCGGTGLYLRALRYGLCLAPPVDPSISAELRAATSSGDLTIIADLHRQLAACDPAAAARIAPRDGQRIERALGVFRSTGRRLSDWQSEHGFQSPRHDIRLIGITMARPLLDLRIRHRVAALFDDPRLQTELSRLALRSADARPRALDAIGYLEALLWHAGKMTRTDAIERVIIRTRQYAKRQTTWFVGDPTIRWFQTLETAGVAPSATGVAASDLDPYIASFWNREGSDA